MGNLGGGSLPRGCPASSCLSSWEQRGTAVSRSHFCKSQRKWPNCQCASPSRGEACGQRSVQRAQAGRAGGGVRGASWALPGAPTPPSCVDRALTLGLGWWPCLPGLAGGRGPRWEERGGCLERGTRPGPGRPGAGTALPPRHSPALPRPGGFLLCTHLRAICPAQLGPSLGSSGPFPPDALLASGLRAGFSGGLWTPWPGLLLLPLVSSVLCVCPTL